MERLFLHCLCLVALLSSNLANCTITEDEESRRTYPTRRAIDGTRGRKYYVQEEGNPYDGYGTSNGQYNPYEDETDLSDIRNNIPGEPGVDYPAYTRLPQTEFFCESHFKAGYYADEGAGCQVFHVCDGNFLVSSFLCPIGLIFSQKLLTCDWWAKVDCTSTRNYYAINSPSMTMSETIDDDEDEILRKAFEMARVKSAAERIPTEIIGQSQVPNDHQRNKKYQRIFNYDSTVTERINDLSNGRESYSDYSDYPIRQKSSSHKTTRGKNNRQRYEDEDYYYQNDETENQQPENGKSSIRVETNGEEHNYNRQNSLRNELRPSYAPTVPTIMTTERKFYSPTVPTTQRTFTTRETFARYDLEFEGSDHLYTARGRSDEILKAATPPSYVKSDDVKFKNIDSASLIDSDIDATRDDDKIKVSESFNEKIHLPIEEQVRQNFTKDHSHNETIISLNDKEAAIKKDLDRLTEKITQTLSILTFDGETRDPNIFSYSHDEKPYNTETNVKDILVEPSVVENSTFTKISSDLKNSEKPVQFLQPPRENQSQFRINVLDETLTGHNEKISKSELFFVKNSTMEKNRNFQVSAESPIPKVTSNENDIRESRIIHIVVKNNGTSEKTLKDKEMMSKIFIENLKSIDLSPEEVFSVPSNFTETRMIVGKKVDETLKIGKKIDENSLNSEKAENIVSASTTIGSNDVTEIVKIFNLKDNDETSKVTNVTLKFTPIEIISPISTSENNDVTKKSIGNDEILSNATRIDETIEAVSLPLERDPSLKKNVEIDTSGDEIRKFMIQKEFVDTIGAADYKSFEIVRSNVPKNSRHNTEMRNFNYDTTSLRTDESLASNENLQNFQSNDRQSTNNPRGIVAFPNGSNLPRPFSFKEQFNADVKAPSDISDELISPSLADFSETRKNIISPEIMARATLRTKQSIVSPSMEEDLEKSLETLEASSSGLPRDGKNNRPITNLSSRNFGDRERKMSEEKLIFQLPELERFVNFETGHSLGVSKEFDTGTREESVNVRSNGTSENVEKFRDETVVRTEFIPSLGFSLNTEEEREKYMEAVFKGLLHDFTATETTNNETNTSIES